MNYTVVTASSILALIPQVQKHCNNNWAPIGGIATAIVGTDTVFMQAMVFYSYNTPSPSLRPMSKDPKEQNIA